MLWILLFPSISLICFFKGDEGSGKSSLIARLQTRKQAVDEKSAVGTGLEYTLIDVKDDYEGEGITFTYPDGILNTRYKIPIYKCVIVLHQPYSLTFNKT